MTNTMPMLTDSEREELIQYASEEVRLKTEHIDRLEKHMPGQFDTSRYQMELLTAQIALAALTATRKGFIEAKSSGTDSFILKGFYLHGLSIDDDIYTAPPVPSLKPIELPEPEQSEDDSWWYDASRVNAAIRAAGYGVKE